MGIFSHIAGNKVEKRSATPNIPDFLMGGGSATRAGVSVTDEKVLSLSAVWSVIDRISSTMGIFPFKVYRNEKDGHISQADHPCQRLLQKEPNPYLSAYDFKFLMMSNQLLYGVGIAEIEFDKRTGFPIALHPVHPNKVQVVNKDGKLSYKIEKDNGGGQVVRQPHEILLFRLFPTVDGGWRNPLQIHRETFGAALAVRDFASSTFGSGTHPSAIISGCRGDLDEASQASLVERFSAYSGLGRSHSLMLLQDNEKFQPVSSPLTDLQLLETRQFDISEIARIYNVPLHLLAEMEKATSWGTGLSEMNQLFIEHVMMKHVKRWEEEINKKLIFSDDDSLYGRFVMDGLLRGNTKERMESYRTGSMLGLYSINEIRAMEERNPIEDGDVRMVPANFQTLDKAVHGIEKDNQNESNKGS